MKDKIIFGIMGIIIIIIATYLIVLNVSKEDNVAAEQTTSQINSSKYADITENPVVTMTVKDYGTMEIELYPQIAPNTVENFITLANNGYYNGLTFHRIVDNFMIQGGDRLGNGTGSARVMDLLGNDDQTTYTISQEFNSLSHEKGVISMARGSDVNSASSQFFIVNETSGSIKNSLDGKYTGFGKLISGEDVLDAISKVAVSYSSSGELSSPDTDVIIESVTVDTKGVTYDVPVYITK